MTQPIEQFTFTHNGADDDDFRAAVWGIESTSGDYLREVAQDLVGEL